MKKKIKSKDLDEIFDKGEDDILEYCDTDNATRGVLVHFPIWMIKVLDGEAKRLGINRQAVIKTWLSDHIKKVQAA